MGTKFIESGADYSAISLGHAGLYTSVTSGLLALFETRRSASKAINNSAPGGASGSVLGVPTFSAGSAAVTLANSVLFPTAPTNGSQTLALVVKKKTGGAVADHAAGNFSGAAPTKGAAYFSLYNWRLTLEATSFATGAVPPLSGSSNRNAAIDTDAVSEFELFVGVLESNVSLRLYRPKTGTVVTTSAVGRDFVYASPENYRTVSSGTAAQDVALFAQWNRVLTPAEIATFYAEMQPQYARLGLAI